MDENTFKLSDKDKLDLLQKLVAFQSVNNHELDVAKFIQSYLKKYDIDSQILPLNKTRANLVAEIGHASPVIAISGHMDVVSPGDLNLWKTNPFELIEKDGRLYARGAADMKSGLAAMITTLIELKQNGLPKQGTVKFMATVGEEVGGYGSKALAADHWTDGIDALVVGEPSGHEIIYAHKGSMDIRLTSKGIIAHSSMPERGYNALNPLLDILYQAKQDFANVTKQNSVLGPLVYNATILNSGDQVNSIPDLAVAEMNARTIPEYSNESVKNHLSSLVSQANQQGAKVKMDVYMSELPVLKQPDNPLTDSAQKTAKQILGIDFVKRPSGGVTDASNLLKDYQSPTFPFMMFGPGDYRLAHKVNEYVDKREYLSFSDVYEQVIQEFLGTK